MSNLQGHHSTTDTLIHIKYQHFKTLIFKLKQNKYSSDLSTFNSDQLDQFVDQIIIDLQNTLSANTNHLRQRIKQAKPHTNDPHYQNKIITYKQLLQQIILIIQKLQNIIGRTLDELHILVGQLSNDILINHGNNIERLLQQHEQRTTAFINQQWTKHINQIELKLNTLEL